MKIKLTKSFIFIILILSILSISAVAFAGNFICDEENAGQEACFGYAWGYDYWGYDVEVFCTLYEVAYYNYTQAYDYGFQEAYAETVVWPYNIDVCVCYGYYNLY